MLESSLGQLPHRRPGDASFGARSDAYQQPEVDHPALIAELEQRRASGELLGWALSTSGKIDVLRWLLPLCPPDAHLAPWVKPHHPSVRPNGRPNCWESLLGGGGRQQPPGVRDWLQAMPARHGGTLPGRKPLAFCAWLYGLLGMVPGDELIDRFPGTGIVGRAWRFLSSTSDASPLEPCDASSLQVGDASRAADASRSRAA